MNGIGINACDYLSAEVIKWLEQFLKGFETEEERMHRLCASAEELHATLLQSNLYSASQRYELIGGSEK